MTPALPTARPTHSPPAIRRSLLERLRRKRVTTRGRPWTAESSWHRLHRDEVLRLLDVDPRTGLSTQQAVFRREKYGWNRVTQRPAMPAWLRFAFQFHQPLSYLLLAAVVVTAFLGEWVDGVVILGVV